MDKATALESADLIASTYSQDSIDTKSSLSLPGMMMDDGLDSNHEAKASKTPDNGRDFQFHLDGHLESKGGEPSVKCVNNDLPLSGLKTGWNDYSSGLGGILSRKRTHKKGYLKIVDSIAANRHPLMEDKNGGSDSATTAVEMIVCEDSLQSTEPPADTYGSAIAPDAEKPGDASSSLEMGDVTFGRARRAKRRNHRIPLTDGRFIVLYRWPARDDGPVCILQDQLMDFLCFRSFKRKYNAGIARRRIEPKERVFLRTKRKMRTDQVRSNSVVLLLDEVLALLRHDFPKHGEMLTDRFNCALSNGELNVDCRLEATAPKRQIHRNRRVLEDEAVCLTPSLRWLARFNNGDLIPELAKDPRLLQEPESEVAAASTYNSLLRARRARVFKSFNIHTLQMNQIKYGDTSPRNPGRVGFYPVRVLNGQFVDGPPRRYSSECLFRLPFNTVIRDRRVLKCAVGAEPARAFCPKCGLEVVQEPNSFVDGSPAEPFIKCSQCQSYSHARCLEMGPEMLAIALTYNWQCFDCKVCSKCNLSTDEDLIIFCDRCDRGFHAYCVGLLAIPKGSWVCKPCGGEDKALSNTSGRSRNPRSSRRRTHFTHRKGGNARTR